MINELNAIENRVLGEVSAAASAEELEKVKVGSLGRKGTLTEILRKLSALPADERKTVGEKANNLRSKIESAIEEKTVQLKRQQTQGRLESEKIDISGRLAFPFISGHPHPLRETQKQIIRIFGELGFEVAGGPEIETDWYNFEALNIPKDHPARDSQDTFYITGSEKLLRTHTSPAQVHVMEKQKPPVKVIIPGRVYRNEATDATHSATFHQVEGLAVDENITFGDLKGTLTIFIQKMFGPELKVRFRPSHFQFTEPSAEVDVQCFICKGKGCRICKNTGWIELLGCGMVHPNVFKAVNYDTERYTGFAFGMGIERLTMLRIGLDDMRLLYENNLQFLNQF
jgi:phenylalanyl-tRNA synthetase alpha chain